MLDTKKQYVRFISHELRTPLNAAFLGLKLLTDELKASLKVEDRKYFETLTDVNLSLVTAIDILNDLLCFEKLDSGILKLHKTIENIMSFMINSVEMFVCQSKECGVQIKQLHENLSDSDVILIDKFKINQVIRNLV